MSCGRAELRSETSLSTIIAPYDGSGPLNTTLPGGRTARILK
jgi:hypothetical protein